MKRGILRATRYLLGFSYTETLGYGTIILALLIISGIVEVKKLHSPTFTDDQLRQLAVMDSIWTVITSLDTVIEVPGSMQHFDPNIISYDSMVRWGLSKKVAANLIRYRDAGGRYRTKVDVRKIYGLNDSIWARIEPFILLPFTNKGQEPSKKTGLKQKPYTRKLRNTALLPFDINLADSAQLKSISGIGDVLSQRIIKYKELLGGYYNKDQLHEVYGLSPEVCQRLKKGIVINSDYSYHKISLNTFDYQDLARHPYLTYRQAGAIVAYRNSHGPFGSLEQLKAIHLIDDSTYIKVYPYLDF